MSEFTWRRVTETDLELLRHWLQQPHVHRWWHHETTPEAVDRDFGPAARGQEPSLDLLVLRRGLPFGLVQRAVFGDYPAYIADLAPYLEVSPHSFSLDYFVADAGQTNRGLGTKMISAILAQSWMSTVLENWSVSAPE